MNPKVTIRYFLIVISFLGTQVSNMAIAQNGIVIGNVSDQYGPLPGAELAIEGINKTFNADIQGNFEIKLPNGEYKLIASFPLYESQGQQLKVGSGENTRVFYILKLKKANGVEVTIGSRGQPRSLLETAVPVDVISAREIAHSSKIELGQILHYASPSFHSTHQTISDGTDHVDPATLRGLGPDQVLILINGKRRHASSLINVNGTVGRGTVGTDLNAIPVAAIDRIEILRDGAAAQYGSDAIAGVINIILKEEVGTGTVNFNTGVNSEGDGLEVSASGNYGFQIGDKGFVNLTAEFRNRGATNRSGNYTGSIYSDDETIDNQMVLDNDFFGETGFDDKQIMEIGNSASANTAVFFNASIPVADETEFYAHGGINYRNGKAHGFYRLPKDKARVVTELFPNGFSPIIHSDILDQAITIGLKGKAENWNLDFGNTFGSNKFDFTVNNSNNASLGMASPTNFYAGGFAYGQNTTNLGATRKFDWLESVNVAFGGMFRIENYQIFSGGESSWVDGGDTVTSGGTTVPREAGAQVFPGFRPQNELNKHRTNTAAYLDVEANLTKKLLLGAATRYELYSDFGSTVIFKLVGRYRHNKTLTGRLGYATGFRAPSLHQVYFSNIGVQFIDGLAVSVGTFNNQSAVASAFGIGDLKPELSQHLSGGFTTNIMDGLSFTLDGYLINITDRIVLSGRFASGYEAKLAPLNTGAAQFFTNAIDTRTYGLDAVVHYRNELGKGTLGISVAANFSQTWLKGHIKVSSELKGNELDLFNREEISRIEVAQPGGKIISTLDYERGKFIFRLQNTWFGRVKYVHPDDGDKKNWVVNELTGNVESRDQTFGARIISNASVSIHLINSLQWTIGANNLFNVYPEMHTHSANISSGRFIYSRRVQQFGVQGTHVYTRLSMTL